MLLKLAARFRRGAAATLGCADRAQAESVAVCRLQARSDSPNGRRSSANQFLQRRWRNSQSVRQSERDSGRQPAQEGRAIPLFFTGRQHGCLNQMDWCPAFESVGSCLGETGGSQQIVWQRQDHSYIHPILCPTHWACGCCNLFSNFRLRESVNFAMISFTADFANPVDILHHLARAFVTLLTACVNAWIKP